MTELVEKARNRLKEIEDEAIRLRVFLAVVGELEGGNTVETHSENSAHESTEYDSDTASPAEIVDVARQLMQERGRPLGRGALVKALRERGLILPGADPAKNIGTVIWRSKQFDNVAGHGYWPKDMPRWMGQRQRELGVE